MDAPCEVISAGPVRLRRVCADDLDRMVTAALACAGLRLASIDHVEIHCDAKNAASGAVAARLGFEHVETRSVEITWPGESGRLQVWRLTSDRWPTSAAAELRRAHGESPAPLV